MVFWSGAFMSAQFSRKYLAVKQYRYVRTNDGTAIVVPVVAVFGLATFGWLLERWGLVRGFYASPFVLLAGVVANRVCIRAGLMSALLGAVVFDVVFAAPRWQLSLPTVEEFLAYSSMFAIAVAVARRQPVERDPPPPHQAGQSLPFTSQRPKTTRDDGSPDGTSLMAMSFWSVEATEVWADDTEVGIQYGRIYMDAVRRGSAVMPLAWIVRDMIKSGKFTGVEAGFCGIVGATAKDNHARYQREHDLVAHDDADDFGPARRII